MLEAIKHLFTDERILILGFGKEGRSTARFLQNHVPGARITIADADESLDTGSLEFDSCEFILGTHYLDSLAEFDRVVKSPGIPSSLLDGKIDKQKLTSQTDLFLRMFRDRTIGITGTKGKSTTSSLIYNILDSAGEEVFLLGNIGSPPLDFAEQITADSLVVFEMSSHQLDGIQISPRYAVLLNIFEEHLDHYKSMKAYRQAKYNIFKHQGKNDWLVYNCDDPGIARDLKEDNPSCQLIGFAMDHSGSCGAYAKRDNLVTFIHEGRQQVYDFSGRLAMPGRHNLMNILAAVCVGEVLSIRNTIISFVVNGFPGLEHRLEFVGEFKRIRFYNDSIATIPEATIEAIKTLGKVDTLILGGKDRGINYMGLVTFLRKYPVPNIVLVGEVGNMLKDYLGENNDCGSRLIHILSYGELADVIRRYTPKEGVCLLSPAASSYDMFKNFEERGRVFKKIAENL